MIPVNYARAGSGGMLEAGIGGYGAYQVMLDRLEWSGTPGGGSCLGAHHGNAGRGDTI